MSVAHDLYCREPACSAAFDVDPSETPSCRSPLFVQAQAAGWDPARALCPECAEAHRFNRALADRWEEPIPATMRDAARARLVPVVSRLTGAPGPPLYLLDDPIPGILGDSNDPSAADPWAVAIRFELLYALAEDGSHTPRVCRSLSGLAGEAVERLAETCEPLEWLQSSHARWLYASRAIADSSGNLCDLSEAVWEGARLEAERLLPDLIRPMLAEAC